MKFYSTRDSKKTEFTSAEVIKKGLADDGGLFVPETIPLFTNDEIQSYCSMSYAELAAAVLEKFLSDYSHDELIEDTKIAYENGTFPTDPCPLYKVDESSYSLELWHGPTCAFKDMALQIMPRLLSRSLVKTGEKRDALVLVATSGDTGKAALEGYCDVDRIKIAVFYPENGVSTMQKLQMATQTGSNVHVSAVEGNFDDIQTGVKKVFSNSDYAAELDSLGYFLSSANSINFGRLAPQIVYYVKSYCDLLNKGAISYGDFINVCVPTGNFGNILAAYITKLMGLPIKKLICASNSNNILTDFLRTGVYDTNRNFRTTMSPSMDILISSNLERLLYFICGADQTAEYMKSLKEDGKYQVSDEIKAEIDKNLVGYYADEYETMTAVREMHDNFNYLIDTHTGVAFSALEQYRNETKDNTVTVVASTANPYKFAHDVHDSIYDDIPLTDLRAFAELERRSKVEPPAQLKDLPSREIRFNGCIAPDDIYNEVLRFINK